ncbi:MAG: hypothetical protein R2822_17025 [Spirosomataceae bacterium]
MEGKGIMQDFSTAYDLAILMQNESSKRALWYDDMPRADYPVFAQVEDSANQDWVGTKINKW